MVLANNIAGVSEIMPGGTAGKTAAPSQPDDGFAAALKEAVKNQITEETIALNYPADSLNENIYSSSLNNGGTIESLILTAAASGEADDAQIAVFMLCMMMSENEDSEMGALMNSLAAVLTDVGDGREAIRQRVMNSDYSPYVLDTVDKNVFKAGAQALPAEPWKAATPLITSNTANRSPETLRRVIDQFDVENSERYRPYRRGGDTYCNIFVWDVTSALGAEIPHYVNAVSDAPEYYPNIKGARELGANATYDWLLENGRAYGWREVSPEEAQARANDGQPVVTAWKNPSGASGHVQIVCPSQNGAYDKIRGVTVAQAGSVLSDYTYISSIFGNSKLAQVKYFAHE
jgi:hypothetical protein